MTGCEGWGLTLTYLLHQGVGPRCSRGARGRTGHMTLPLPYLSPLSLSASGMTDVSNGYVSSDELLGVNEAPFNTSAASNNSTGMAMLIGYSDRGGRTGGIDVRGGC